MARVAEVVRPFADRAANPPARECDDPVALSRPKMRSPLSEDRPSPRCRIADARKGAETFGGVYWVADAIPLLIRLLIADPIGILTDRPGRFWGAFVLVTAFVLFLALH